MIADRSRFRGWTHWGIAVALLLGAFGVRLTAIQSKALWWDEGLTVYFANLSVSDYLDLRWMDIHPPLYRFLMLGFVRLTGSSDFAVRFASVGLGLLAVALVFVLGRRIAGGGGGVLSGSLAAISPFALYHSQEAKMYALLLVLSAVTLLTAERLLSGEPAPGWWAGYVVGSSAALWTHYYAATTLFAVNLAYLALWLRRVKHLPSRRAWGIAQALAVGLFVPWVVLDGGRIPADADRTIGGAALDPLGFAGEIWSTLAAGYPLSGTAIGGGLAVAFLALVVVGLLDGSTGGRQRLLLMTALLTPIVIGVLVSIRFPYNAPRFFIASAPPFAILTAIGCAVLARRGRVVGIASATGVVLAGAIGTSGVYAQGSLSDDYRPLLSRLTAEGRPEDTIFCGYPWQAGYVQAYAPGVGRIVFPIPEQFESYADSADRIWVLSFRTPEGEGDYIRTRLERRALQRVVAASSGESRIALFARQSGG